MLKDLKTSIEKLIANYETTKAKSDALAESLRRCEAENEAYRKQIIELENQIDTLKLAGALTGSAQDKIAAKQRIDRLIREIDKCISLMED